MPVAIGPDFLLKEEKDKCTVHARYPDGKVMNWGPFKTKDEAVEWCRQHLEDVTPFWRFRYG